MARSPEYATKKELEAYKKYCDKKIKEAMKDLKSWDKKQDKKLLKRPKK